MVIGVGAEKDDADQVLAAAGRGEDKAVAGLPSKAGFDAGGSLIDVEAAGVVVGGAEQIIGIGPGVGVMRAGGGQKVVLGFDDLGEERDIHGVGGETGKVVGGGIVVDCLAVDRVGQAVRD